MSVTSGCVVSNDSPAGYVTLLRRVPGTRVTCGFFGNWASKGDKTPASWFLGRYHPPSSEKHTVPGAERWPRLISCSNCGGILLCTNVWNATIPPRHQSWGLLGKVIAAGWVVNHRLTVLFCQTCHRQTTKGHQLTGLVSREIIRIPWKCRGDALRSQVSSQIGENSEAGRGGKHECQEAEHRQLGKRIYKISASRTLVPRLLCRQPPDRCTSCRIQSACDCCSTFEVLYTPWS